MAHTVITQVAIIKRSIIFQPESRCLSSVIPQLDNPSVIIVRLVLKLFFHKISINCAAWLVNSSCIRESTFTAYVLSCFNCSAKTSPANRLHQNHIAVSVQPACGFFKIATSINSGSLIIDAHRLMRRKPICCKDIIFFPDTSNVLMAVTSMAADGLCIQNSRAGEQCLPLVYF
jgi:hypothetical protein